MINISIEIDQVIRLNELGSIRLPNAGIYLLLDENDTPIYIGITADMKKRLLDHSRGYTNTRAFHNDIHKAAIIYEADKEKQLLGEKYLIHKYETLRNVHSNGKREGFIGLNPFGKCPHLVNGNYPCGRNAQENGLCSQHGGNGITFTHIQELAVEEYLKKHYPDLSK